jgi:hypothetical protein
MRWMRRYVISPTLLLKAQGEAVDLGCAVLHKVNEPMGRRNASYTFQDLVDLA